MNEQDPKRLREGGGGGELRSLLEAGRSEVPSDGQMLMLAAKIGIIGGLGGAGAAGAAAAGGGGAGAGGAAGAGAVGGKAAAAAGSAVKIGLAVKVIGAVAIVGAAGTGAAVVVAHRQVETTAPVGLVATEVASAGAGKRGAGAGASASAGASADADAGLEAEPSASASASARNTARNTAGPKDEGPEAEVRLVEKAQKARQGSPAEALALCNDHARRFPNGVFTQECEVIAIEALVKTGRKDEARRRADRFKARFPGSSGIRRIDVLLGD